MKNTLIVIAVLALLSGCAFTNKTYDFKGNPATSIRCSWAFPDACYREADKQCPKGYTAIQRDMDFDLLKNQNSLTIVCK